MAVTTTAITKMIIKTATTEIGIKLALNDFPLNPVYITKYQFLLSALGISN